MSFEVEKAVRQNIRDMKPYSSARHEFSVENSVQSAGSEGNIFLDANENAFGSPLPENHNRYPDPLQVRVKEKISAIKGVPEKNIFLGNGSDEAIDLLIRIFCRPGIDNIMIFPPTYGMYEVCAAMNDVSIKKILLKENFQLDLDTIENSIDSQTKIIFICSPNNPTGNSINQNDIDILLNNFDGLVVIDEAYINYSRQRSFIARLTEYPNLVVLQTLSKAWGLAGLRLGIAFASEQIIRYMNKVKYPYNISSATQQLTIEALSNIERVNELIKITVKEREQLSEALSQMPFIIKIYPSDSNFILVKMINASDIYQYLISKKIIVRDRSNVSLCEECLRITIGTPEENRQLIESLNEYSA